MDQAGIIATPHQLQPASDSKVSGEPQQPQSAWGRYVTLLSQGFSKVTAVERSGITGSELAEARRDVRCAQVELACLRAAATGDLSVVTRLLAQSEGPSLLLDAIEESRDRDGVTPRDRLANRRMALEVAGALGSQRQGQGGGITITSSQVAILLQQEQQQQKQHGAG